MIAVRLVLLSLVCVACGTPPDFQPSAELTALEIDVVVTDDVVELHVREVLRSCICPYSELPKLGECVADAEGLGCSCDPGPGSCLERVWAEVDGELVAFARWGDDWRTLLGGLRLEIEGLAESGATLFLRGCGGEAAISLLVPETPVPRLQSIELFDDDLHVEWTTSPPAASTLISASYYSSRSCHTLDSRMTFDGYGPDPASISVTALTEVTPVQTELGVARIRYGGHDGVYFPDEWSESL